MKKIKSIRIKKMKGINKNKGWMFEGTRHGLAAKGIKTYRKHKKKKYPFRKGEDPFLNLKGRKIPVIVEDHTSNGAVDMTEVMTKDGSKFWVNTSAVTKD